MELGGEEEIVYKCQANPTSLFYFGWGGFVLDTVYLTTKSIKYFDRHLGQDFEIPLSQIISIKKDYKNFVPIINVCYKGKDSNKEANIGFILFSTARDKFFEKLNKLLKK